MPGRRWSDGLHQAIEAKEGLKIKEENQTLATITYQNYFKLYNKLAGMTGTAMTEADEFWEIYKLDVVEIPPNKPLARIDSPDRVYRTEREKFNAIAEEVFETWKRGQPMLIGTRSIEKSEQLSNILRAKGIPHQVLNAKYHEMEAQIIAQAGRKGQVTIATNMAGRGTDIVLGGTPYDEAAQKEVAALGGLYVIGTERHESRRIDNQLRGRCARQGDPGASVFYVSLGDELMRLFGSDRIASIMERLGMKEGEVIESSIITKQIAGAQKRVEGQNFDARKHLLDYDNVMNKQRLAIYSLRDMILDGKGVPESVKKAIEECITEHLNEYAPEKEHANLWDFEKINVFLKRTFGFEVSYSDDDRNTLVRPALEEDILDRVKMLYEDRQNEFEERGISFAEVERMLFLQIIDQVWKNHLYELDHLKKGVGLRAYGQKDPLVEYQKESYYLFENMMNRIRDTMVSYVFRVHAPAQPAPQPAQDPRNIRQAGEPARMPGNNAEKKKSPLPVHGKIGRNDPCPCGSGKKYKKCHGANL